MATRTRQPAPSLPDILHDTISARLIAPGAEGTLQVPIPFASRGITVRVVGEGGALVGFAYDKDEPTGWGDASDRRFGRSCTPSEGTLSNKQIVVSYRNPSKEYAALAISVEAHSRFLT